MKFGNSLGDGKRFLILLTIGLTCVLSLGHAQDCEKCPPCPSNSSLSADDPNCDKDPAFVLADPKPKLSLLVAQAALGQIAPQSSAELDEKESKRLENFDVAIQAKPEETMSRVFSIWQDDCSKDCKRLAILSGMKMTKSTDDQATLKFMLDVLSDPQTQKTEIGRLGRGNSLEKQIAAKRMAVIKQNPQLAKL